MKYLDDFSKALSEEVRMLLKEVGKLREEKRALQQCVRFTLSQNLTNFTCSVKSDAC
jgi:hypothetical protein